MFIGGKVFLGYHHQPHHRCNYL